MTQARLGVHSGTRLTENIVSAVWAFHRPLIDPFGRMMKSPGGYRAGELRRVTSSVTPDFYLPRQNRPLIEPGLTARILADLNDEPAELSRDDRHTHKPGHAGIAPPALLQAAAA